MKNILKYSFSILIMVSCIVVAGILAFKVLILDETPAEEAAQPEETAGENKTDIVQKPNPEDAHFVLAGREYFSDALFIGDSRTMGLWQYGKAEGADFFANTGMSVYNIMDTEVDVSGNGKVTLEQLLESKQYGKIYLMLGINELGFGREKTVNKYKELLDWIKEKSPNSIIYIQANLHVSASRSESDETFNNANINEFNERISEFIDNEKVFYIDANEIFDDENGNLKAEYTSDNTHVLAKYYVFWVDWLLTKTAAPDSDNT